MGTGNWFKLCLMATSALSYVYSPVVLAEDISPADVNTTRYTAPNGVTVVNIAKPNITGLSHNRYNNFNVTSTGAVLNNTNQVLQSKLAGAIRGNPNIAAGHEASVILNEVTSANRSTLRGFLEVHGKKADVIISNPWGIMANGVGFINTGRATLTTGTPNIDANGKLNGFNVRTGDIRVEGNGINATSQNYLDLVARSVQVGSDTDGKGDINAQNLYVAAGSNEWNYDTRETRKISGTGSVPTYAIDTRALGGMYANRIQMVATESGVGVRALGDMAASAEDLIITSSGSLELRNKISSEKNVTITYDGDNTGNVTLTDASVSAKKDVTMTSNMGAVNISGGLVRGDEKLSITAASLSDSGTTSNTRSAGTDVNVTTTGATSVNGTKWSAGNNATYNVASFSVGANGAEIYAGLDSAASNKTLDITATSGDVNLKTAKLGSSKDINIKATSGGISVTSGGSQEIEAQNDITLSAKTTLTNSGEIISNKQMTIRGTDGATDLALTNTGTIQAGTTLDMAGAGGGDALSVANNDAGKMIAGKLALRAKSLSIGASTAKVQGGVDSALNLSGTLINNGSILGTGNYTINAGQVSNSSTAGIASTAGLTLTFAGAFSNDGSLYAGTDLTLNGSGQTFTNSATGTIDTGNDLSISVATLNNYNDIRAGHDATISTTVAFNNIMNVLNGTMTDEAITYKGMTQAQMAAFDDEAAHNDVIFWDDASGNYKFKTGINHGDNVGQRVGASVATSDDNWSVYQYFGNYTEEGGLLACADGCGQWTYKMVRGQAKYTETNILSSGASVDKSLISAGGTLTIDYGSGTGLNDGSVLTAGTINIKGSGSFTNNARAHEKKTEYAMYKYFVYAADDSDDPDVNQFSRIITNTGTIENNGQLYYKLAGFADDANWVNTGDEASARTYALDHLIYNKTDLLGSVGAGVFATNLNIETEGQFNNISATVAKTAGASKNENPDTSKAGSTVAFAGLNLSLPTNPNGYFVATKDPNAAYLIETNPSFGLDADYLGSDYLLEKLNLAGQTTKVIRRLGDANYENQSIQNQIKNQTGRTILSKYKQNAAAQTKGLLDNAVKAASDLKLAYGVALSKAQINNLKHDIVWMVKTVVQGKTVVAPVVYLAKATLNANNPRSAVLVAENTNIKVDAFTNRGGTVAGSENLTITAKNDIRNTAGTIRGGNVSLAAQNIINETTAADQGGATGGTQVSKTASIEATKSLQMAAVEDIQITGAKVSSKGSASLNAGGDVVLAGLETKARSQEKSYSSSGKTTSYSATQTVTTKNIGSTLDVGGDLKVNAGNDITLQGSQVNVKGDGDLKAGNDINLLAAQEGTKTTTQSGSETKASSFGFIKGSSSSTKTTAVDEVVTAAVSGLNIGGNLKADAGNNIVAEGANISAGKSASLKAEGDVQLLAARESRTRTSETTSSANSGGIGALSVDAFSNKSSWDTAQTAKGTNLSVGQNLNVEAGQDAVFEGAKVDVAGNADLKAGRDIVTTTAEEVYSSGTQRSSGASIGLVSSVMKANFSKENSVSELKNKGSELNIGGNLNAKSGRDFIVKGSDVNVEGSGTIDAGRDQLVLAAQDRKLTVDKSSQDFGLIGSLVGGLNKSKEMTVDDLKNRGSTENVGGSLNISAKRDIITQGSQIKGDGDVSVNAGRNLMSVAAEDKTVTTTVEKVDKGFSLFAEANSSNDLSSANGGAGAGVQQVGNNAYSASVGIGIQRELETKTTQRTQTTAVTSAISAGGNLTRTAGETLVDQGTEIKAGGNYTQSAKTIKQLAAKNTDTTTTTTNTQNIRYGLYAEASGQENLTTNTKALVDKGKSMVGKAGTVVDGDSSATNKTLAAAGARAQASTIGQDIMNLANSEGEGSVAAGIETRITNKTVTQTDSTSSAVVTNIQVGGNFNSKSQNETVWEGTKVNVGGDTNIAASKLDVKAAQNTHTTTETTNTQQAYVRLGAEVGASGSLQGEGNASAALAGEAGFLQSNTADSERNTTAVVAQLNSGGKLNIQTTGDTNLEGTKLSAKNGIDIKAGGNVNVTAAENTTQKTSDAQSEGAYGKVTFGAQGTVAGGGAGANFNKSNSNETSSNAVVASLNAGQGGLSISSGNNVTLEGTKASGQGALNINAKNNINITAATSTTSSNSSSLATSLDVSVDGKKKGLEAAAAISGEIGSSQTQQGASLNFGSSINTKAGGDTTLQGTQVQTNENVNIQSGGQVNLTAATNSSSSVSGGASGKLSLASGEDMDGGLEATGSISSSQKQTGVSLNADNLNIQSGGKTVLEGTQASLTGKADIDATGGVETKSTVNYSAEASGSVSLEGATLHEADANVSTQGVNIQEGVQKKTKAPKKIAAQMTKVAALMKDGQSRESALQSIGVDAKTYKGWVEKYELPKSK